MATDSISQQAAQAVGPSLVGPRPTVASDALAAAAPVAARPSAGRWSSEAAEDDDYQWLLRWYPFFMAGLILTMLVLGGFWISQFAS